MQRARDRERADSRHGDPERQGQLCLPGPRQGGQAFQEGDHLPRSGMLQTKTRYRRHWAWLLPIARSRLESGNQPAYPVQKQRGNTMADETATLAAYVANLKFEDIPHQVLERAKVLTLDFLGSAIRARRDAESTPSLLKMLEALALDGKGESTVFGDSKTWTPAVAAAKLFGLSKEQITAAFGVSGSQAAGSLQFLVNGAWNKRYQVGAAAMNGVIAATLARNDFVGAIESVEGKHGLLVGYSDNA